MEDTNSLIEQRKAKLAALRAKGINPFANKYKPTEQCAQARSNYVEGREVAEWVFAHNPIGGPEEPRTELVNLGETITERRPPSPPK